MLLFAFAVLLNVLGVKSIPGLSLTNYCDDELIGGCTCMPVVFHLRSSSAHLYLHSWSPDNPTYSSANLGVKLFGEMLVETNIKMQFKKPGECVELCRKTYDPQDSSSMETYMKLLQGIRHSYNRYWVSDNIPVIACKKTLRGEVCEKSFPLGCYKADSQIESTQCNVLPAGAHDGTFYLFNHFVFNITYTAAEPSKYNLIAVQVTPVSIAHDVQNLKCPADQPLTLPDRLNVPLTIVYTYSVHFTEVRDAPLSSRWNYLISEAPHESIQWVSIINSVLVVFFLTILVAIVLVRTLRRDFLRYDKMESESNGTQEEFGWKLVHGDVFRAPRYPMLFAVLIGSGVQMALMSVITLFFGCFGILSPIHRGAFATCAIAVFVCLGASAGYTSARLYKFFNGLCWKTNILMTGLFCPGLVMSAFLVINFVLICLNSSTAVSFTTILSILSMWLLVSLPLCFIGAFFGFRQQVIRVPTRTNQIPRQVPPQSCYTRTLPTMLLNGLLPFGCIFVQLFFIFNSIWGQQLFFMFGFLFLVFVFFLSCVIEIAILTCYFQLCAENYRWWWRSFLSGGSSAIYVLSYAMNYYLFKTQYRGFISGFLYLTCTSLVSGLLFIMLGSVGFLSCFIFTRIIYRAVKVD
ncbi:Transmembrane 9 superfamily member 2 [Taenia crassiceps]|uniref:Transmembrane 9 superfamily member n=1 Tax=Taenia crassiceps TaxID=6207 RepID=A0ABR4Q609_9CEST